MSKIKLTGSNSGYVEIDSAADAGNLTLALPTSGTVLLSNTDNVFSGITTFTGLNITDDVTFNGGSYDVLWDASDNALEFGDNAKLSFGASSDLQLYHDASDSHIANTTGVFYIQNTGDLRIRVDNTDAAIHCVRNGAVEVHHAGNKKFETTNTGAVVTGICTATSFSGSGENLTRTTQYSHRNIIINGEMSVSQRHGTSETTPAHTEFGPDRMRFDLSQSSKFKVQQVTDAPAGFSHSMKVTSLSAYSSGANDYFVLQNMIEGTDSARLNWGTSDAQTVTLSFYVKSSLTGVHACGIRNNAYNRANTQTYTINNANTWERKTVTFTGDTSGSWNVDTNAGLKLNFDLGSGSNFQAASTGTWLGTNDFITSNSVKVVGTNAATWYITGIQLELGDIATPFEHRSFAEELNRCKRYFQSSFPSDVAPQNGYYATNGGASAGYAGATCFSANNARSPQIYYATEMRAQPTVTLYASSNSDTAGKWGIYSAGSGWTTPTSHQIDYFSNRGFGVRYSSASFGTVGESYLYRGMWTADAEI